MIIIKLIFFYNFYSLFALLDKDAHYKKIKRSFFKIPSQKKEKALLNKLSNKVIKKDKSIIQ